MQEVKFLGHVVSPQGVSIDTSKKGTVANWNWLTNPTEVRCFLSLARYYRIFVETFSKIAAPLTG